MSLPAELRPLLRKRDFWRRFFWDLEDDREYPELEECQVVFPLAGEAALVLELDEDLSYFSLNLRHPSLAEPVEIAWDDQAHWHPHVLRWEELDLLGRCAALSDPDLPHPGVVVALLHRFTPLCPGDDAVVAHALLEGAYRSLGVFRGKALEEQLQRYDYRDAGFNWRNEPEHGWVLEHDESAPNAGETPLYTLRRSGNAGFPYMAWAGLMNQARAAYAGVVDPVWLAHDGGRAGALAREMASSGKLARLPELAEALEQAGCTHGALLRGLQAGAVPATAFWLLELLLDEPPGGLLRKHCGRKSRPKRIIHRFQITYPGFPVRPRELPDRSRLEMTAELDRQFRQRLSGRAEMSVMCSTYTPDGKTLLEESSIIECRAADDEAEAIRIIREVLRQHGAPEGTQLRQLSRQEREIPLADDTEG